MRKFLLTAGTALVIASPFAAHSKEYKVDCNSGAQMIVELFRYGDGQLGLPDVVGVICNKPDQGEKDEYKLEGLPGTYPSLKAVEKQVGDLKEVLSSPAMAGADPKTLPPALAFVKGVLDKNAAIVAKANNTGAPPPR